MATRAVATVVAVLLVTFLVLHSTNGAFSATTRTDSSVAAGTVTLVDDDSGSALFNASGLQPDDALTRCIAVTYSGDLTPAAIKLYASSGGTGLATYLTATIDVGTGGTFASCTGFSSATTLYSGTLENLTSAHADWSSGLSAFSAASTPTTRTFRITLSVEDDNAAQGLTATPTFTWEAQPS